MAQSTINMLQNYNMQYVTPKAIKGYRNLQIYFFFNTEPFTA